MDQLVVFAPTYGLKIVGAILFLILGRLAASLVRKGVRRLLRNAKADKAIGTFAANLSFVLVMVFTLISAFRSLASRPHHLLRFLVQPALP